MGNPFPSVYAACVDVVVVVAAAAAAAAAAAVAAAPPAALCSLEVKQTFLCR